MDEKRAALRFPTDIEAACRTADTTWPTRLRNISTSGCMITMPEGDLASECALRLRIKGLPAIDAEIVWQHRNHAGVRFRVPLHPAALEHLGFVLPEGAWESAFRSTREAAAPERRRAVPPPASRAPAPGLNSELVKRVPHAAELIG